MNILFVTEYFPNSEKGEISGGVEARCFYLANELSKRHKVKVICSWRKGNKRKQKIGKIEVVRVGPNHAYSNKGSFLSRLQFAKSAYEQIKKENNIDVVDGFNFTTYIPSYLGARKIGAKTVATYHETWIGDWIKNKGVLTGLTGEMLEGITLNLNWDLIIPVSNFTKRKLADKGISKKKMKVVYNGVTLNEFEKVKVKKSKYFRLITVARLVKTKRIETVLKAIKHINLKGLKFVIVGDGDDASYIKKQAKELKLTNVEFKGFLKTKEEVIKEIKKSTVFCLPSAVEGFGITVVEAMACGVPVICSDIEPLKEVTANGKYGLIFKLDKEKELAQKIELLIKNKKKYEEFRKKGVQRAKEFSWEKISSEYLSAIK